MTDKLRDAEREAFETAYTAAYPFAASAPGKFYRDQDGYADISVTIGWRMWQAALAQQDAQKKHKPLFAEMIAQHPGLAAALAQQDEQAVPARAYDQLFALNEANAKRIMELEALIDTLNAATTPPARSVEAQAVRDGIDAAVNFLESGDDYEVKRKSMAAALRCSGLIFDLWWRAAPTPPAQRVMLTPEEMTKVIVHCYGYSADIEFHECLARAAIEAYERKNGLRI